MHEECDRFSFSITVQMPSARANEDAREVGRDEANFYTSISVPPRKIIPLSSVPGTSITSYRRPHIMFALTLTGPSVRSEKNGREEHPRYCRAKHDASV